MRFRTRIYCWCFARHINNFSLFTKKIKTFRTFGQYSQPFALPQTRFWIFLLYSAHLHSDEPNQRTFRGGQILRSPSAALHSRERLHGRLLRLHLALQEYQQK